MKNANKTKGKLQKMTKKISKNSSSSFNKFATDKQNKKDKKNTDRSLVLAKLQKIKKGNTFKDMRNKKERSNIKQQERDVNMFSKGKKASKFELLSDDENEQDYQLLNLTHKGKNLEKLDDFKDDVREYSDDDDGDMDDVAGDLHENMNFQGFDGKQLQNLGQKKSKKEIYEEIIKKSKYNKMEKQKQREDDMEKLEELEKGYDELHNILNFRGKETKAKESQERRKNGEKDDYDKMIREMSYAEKAPAVVEKKKERKVQVDNSKTRNKQQVLSGILSSDDEDDRDLVNDDELEVGTARKEKKILKHYRNVEKLNSYMNKIKGVKIDRLKQEKQQLEGDMLGEDDEDFDDEEGEEEESSDQYGLDDIDLDDVENNNREEGQDDLEDEYESEEEDDEGEEEEEDEDIDVDL